MARADAPAFDHDVERALVTGATGQVGSWVVDHLADSGVEVVGVDLERPSGIRPNVEFRALDLTRQGATWETMSEVDADAVVHLAAIADPQDNPGTDVFENNVESTYNVFDAAGRQDCDVVWTSSQAVYGALFATETWTPEYLPIDEDHPCSPADPYGLSKVCCEDVGATAARRHDVAVTTIRPATVFSPDKHRARPHGDPTDLSTEDSGGDFGAYVDVRDLARAIEAGLASDHEGAVTVNVAAEENYLGQPTEEIVAAICGAVPEESTVEGRESAVSNAAAEAQLGWRPMYEWGRGEPEDVDGPDWL